MSLYKKQRFIVILSVYLFVFYLALSSYLVRLDKQTFSELIRSLKWIAHLNRTNASLNAHCPTSLPIEESGNWVVNPRVAQYSAYMTIERCTTFALFIQTDFCLNKFYINIIQNRSTNCATLFSAFHLCFSNYALLTSFYFAFYWLDSEFYQESSILYIFWKLSNT